LNDAKTIETTMKNAMLALWGFFIFATPLAATAQQSGDFTYSSDGASATITGYNGSGAVVTIPAEINSLPVTRIGNGAFAQRRELTYVTIPEGIISIDDSAFWGCLGLTAITIPHSVARIGDGAFSECYYLSRIYFLGNAPTISPGSFEGIYSGEIYYQAGASGWSGGYVGGLPTFLWDPSAPPFSYTSSDGVVTITAYRGPGGALTLPSTIDGLPVVSLANGAFGGAGMLLSLAIPYSVTNMGREVFDGCVSLGGITVDVSNPAFSSLDGVLFDKARTTLIRCPEGRAGNYAVPSTVLQIANSAFKGARLAGITIPDGVTSIGGYAFAYAGIPSLTIPSSVTNLGPYASFFSAVRNLNIQANIRSLPILACYQCANLVHAEMPRTITSIGEQAFRNCTSLTNITIPASVTNIGDYVFMYCFNLRGVFFNGNAPTYGWDPYFGNLGLTTSYYLPGAMGWGPTWDNYPAALWNPKIQTAGPNFGVGAGGFGFNITGTTNIPIVVEVCTNLATATWAPLQSLNLTNGLIHFSDAEWSNRPMGAYRIRSP
jgi:hypothetical protein